MSLAKLYTVNKSRKVWSCGKCRAEIPVGAKVIHFAVGFRGREQHRCGKTECYPKPSERESSLLSSLYAAQEEQDIPACTTLEDLQAAVEAVAEAAREVAQEYENNEMFEVNYELQERADTLNSSADELGDWESELGEDEPVEDDEDSWGDNDDFESAHEEFMERARELAAQKIDEMELP